MTQGYITLAVDYPGNTDNIENAALLAMTARMSDPDREFAVVVRSFGDVPSRLEECFDYIVELPFKRTDQNEGNQLIDAWQIYYATPFEETMWITTNSLVVDNLAAQWHGTEHEDLLFSRPLNYKGDIAQYKKKFRAQKKSDLPAFSSDVFFFRKSETASEFFKMADPVFRHWRDIYREYIKEHRPVGFDFTTLVNITTHMIGYENTQPEYQIEYVDIDPDNMPIDLDEDSNADWSEQINIWFYKGQHVKVNNHRQSGIWVYHDEDLLTREARNDIRSNFSKNKTAKAA